MLFVVSPNDPYDELGPDPVAIAAEQKATGNQIVPVRHPHKERERTQQQQQQQK